MVFVEEQRDREPRLVPGRAPREEARVWELPARAVFCGGFYELESVPEPPWIVSAEDLDLDPRGSRSPGAGASRPSSTGR